MVHIPEVGLPLSSTTVQQVRRGRSLEPITLHFGGQQSVILPLGENISGEFVPSQIVITHTSRGGEVRRFRRPSRGQIALNELYGTATEDHPVYITGEETSITVTWTGRPMFYIEQN